MIVVKLFLVGREFAKSLHDFSFEPNDNDKFHFGTSVDDNNKTLVVMIMILSMTAIQIVFTSISFIRIFLSLTQLA